MTEHDGPDLSSVTLVAVSSISVAATVRAIEQSVDQACFGSILLLSDQSPQSRSRSIEWRKIRPITSRQDYSRFMLRELAGHIETEFALCIQWDGYVLSGRGWRDEFLQYDYIGAPWPQFRDSHRVGNGGFSLRSKRLLDACVSLQVQRDEAEDISICRTHRDWLEREAGIRFAPEDLAERFAFERLPRKGNEFGFHGIFNMRSILGHSGFVRMLRSLDPGTIGRSEAREIFWQSLNRGDMGSALHILRNRSRRRVAFNGDS